MLGDLCICEMYLILIELEDHNSIAAYKGLTIATDILESRQ